MYKTTEYLYLNVVPSAAEAVVKSFRRTSSFPPLPLPLRSSTPTSSQYLRKQMEILNVNNNNYRSPAGRIIYTFNNNNNTVFAGRAADRDATRRNLQSYSLPGPHLIGTTIITRGRIRRGRCSRTF